MSKKTLPLILLLVLLLSLYSQSVSAPIVFIPNQNHFIMETIDEPESVDPAWAYDTASRSLIFNVYDTLVFFDQQKVDEFVPHLATEWLIDQPPHPGAPEGTDSTWYFKIREDVKFHDGSTLTTEDVEYSFERLMVMDRTGGPAWKIYEPLLGVYHANMEWPENEACPINLAVVANMTHVWFNLAMPFPSLPFMQILCGSWASIVCKDWCTAHGCWSGYYSEWKDYHDPEMSPLDYPNAVMMGTGPYMLDYWVYGAELSIIRFVDHWQGWPAPHCSRYLDRVTNKIVYEWGIRRLDFLAGVADEVYVPRQNIPELIENWPEKCMCGQFPPPPYDWNPELYPDGIRCLPCMPTSFIDAAMFFTFDVNPESPYVGTGSFPDGIPLDFFSDERIRKAFAYCFDYDTFLEEAYWDEAEQPASCVKNGTPYHNPYNPKYYPNAPLAAVLFAEASGDPTSPAYDVLDLGFTMTITYKTGHDPGEKAANQLKFNIESIFEFLGTTAVIDVLGVPGPAFQWDLVGYSLFKSLMPLFITDWLNEYTDPHDDVHPFMHSEGHFSRFQGYSNATVDALIEQGIDTSDGPARQAIYETLQLMYYQECPSVCLAQPLKRHWERDWVQGWHYNPLFPGQKYFKHMWKGLDCDVNGDNVVDILDAGVVSAYWYPGPPIGPLGYGKIADICPELQYVLSEDPYDAIPKVWSGVAWVPHPSIGAVDIYDAAFLSSHWGDEVG